MQRLATLADTAPALNISKKTLSCRIREGKLPHPIMIGKRARYDLAELLATLKGQVPGKQA